MDSIVCDKIVREIVATDCDDSSTINRSILRIIISDNSNRGESNTCSVKSAMISRVYYNKVFSGFNTIVLYKECLSIVINAYYSQFSSMT